MELPPATRYVPRRGKSFAYQAFGQGRKAVVCFLELSTHLDLLWTDPHWADGLARIAEAARVVIFQQMGVGLSDSIDKVPTLEEQADDVLAVMDAEDIAAATVFGVYSTTMPLVLLAAREPERVESMVLMVPYAQGYHNEWLDRAAGLTPSEARKDGGGDLGAVGRGTDDWHLLSGDC
jgi:pimeloyl-ACP methyl ester carboxylesterase